ncbi:hypothetical protein, partial [Actinomadura montaniterrae]|uniref:hypothetical protein n=1 Tax=Actinomadura montaniterrae TaxID=1803903 RepID=UPI001CEF8A0C
MAQREPQSTTNRKAPRTATHQVAQREPQRIADDSACERQRMRTAAHANGSACERQRMRTAAHANGSACERQRMRTAA